MDPMADLPEQPDFSRRELFRGRIFQPLRDAAARGLQRRRASREIALSILQRPPGAVAEGQFLQSCTRCGDCIDACPPRAIEPAPESAGPRRSGTPMIDAVRQPCVMCSDTPCISACDPGVLRLDFPLKMADASIDQMACLPWQGQPCTLCVDHCPVPGAITTDETGRPSIDSQRCTGCGVCVQVCPAPRPAVDHRPIASRPFWTGQIN